MNRQLPLALHLHHHLGFDDFVAGANQPLLGILRAQLGDGEPRVFVSGSAGSGRSHLLMSQCRAAEALGLRCAYLPLGQREEGLDPCMLDGLENLGFLALDDIDRVADDAAWELALFNLFNRSLESGTRMLFSALTGPTRLPLALADLRSRLAWGVSWHLQALDDEAQCELASKLAARRGLSLDDGVARYLVQRGSRGNQSLSRTLERLDRASMAEQRPLTIPFVRRLLHGDP